MAESPSQLDILSRAKAAAGEDLTRNLDDIIAHSKDLCDDPEKHEERLDAIQFLIQRIIRLVPLYEVDRKVLEWLLQSMHSYLDEVFQTTITIGYETDDDMLKDVLDVAIVLLDSLSECLDCFMDKIGTSVLELKSIPERVPPILFVAFEYCQRSKANHDLLETIKDSVKQIFDKSKGILGKFGTMCETVFNFDVNDETSMNILLSLCSDLAKLKPVLVDLDFRSYGVVWKCYARLCKNYASAIQDLIDVSTGLETLAERAIKSLDAIESSINPSIAQREIGICGFSLKLIKHQSDLFIDHLGKDFSVLFRLFGRCFKFDPSFLQDNLQQRFRQEIYQKTLLSLSDLAKDRFLAEFVLNRKHSPELICPLSVLLHKIPGIPPDSRSLWFVSKEKNLFQTLFDTFENEDSPFLSPNEGFLSLNIQANGNSEIHVGIYEFVLIHSQAFLAGANPEELEIVLRVLLANILQEQFWRRQLAKDLWCFLSRYSSPDLCANLFQCAADLYQKVQCPQLEGLLRRTFMLMASKDQEAFLSALPTESKKRKLEELSDEEDIFGSGSVVWKRDVKEFLQGAQESVHKLRKRHPDIPEDVNYELKFLLNALKKSKSVLSRHDH